MAAASRECVSQISEWFESKTAFVSGATGFMGKALVEKMLRETRVEKMYLLLRSEDEHKLSERFEEYKENTVFNRIRDLPSDPLSKLVPIRGDMTLRGLGLSHEDTATLCARVHVVFHCAASVRFNDTLKQAVILNTQGTMEMIKLAKKFRKIESLVHISTAFSNIDKRVIEERVYTPMVDWRELIELCNDSGADAERSMERVTQSILRVFPNTYVLSKNLAESVVKETCEHVPCAIVRPSVVCPSYTDPYPGWVDSSNGPMGVLLGATTGAIRTVNGRGDICPDILPVDYGINAAISVAVHIGKTGQTDVPVYNCTTSSEAPVTWNQFLDIGREAYMRFPMKEALWYPGGAMHSNYIVHLFYFIMFQFIPAMLIDTCLFISRRRTLLVKLQKRIFRNLKLFEHFLNTEWKWTNDNLRLLYSQMTLRDQFTFNFDANKIDYKEYIENWVQGSRKFVLKLEDDSLAAARNKLNVLFYLDLAAKSVLYCVIAKLITLTFHSLQTYVLLDDECTTCALLNSTPQIFIK